MASIAIQIGIAVGAGVVSYLLAPKPKLEPVDRGKLDDIRVTTAEEGTFLPRCYGRRVRLGGVIVWATPTYEHISVTPGRTGGKGGGGNTPPPERHFTYTKSLDVVLCATRSRALRRIWDGTEVVFDARATQSGAGYYEAEEALLGGGARVEDCDECSGSRHVNLTFGDTVEFPQVVALARASGPLVVYYTAPDDGEIRITSGLGEALGLTLPSASVPTALVTAFPDLPDGGDSLQIENIGGSPVQLDRIYYRPGLPERDPGDLSPVSGALASGDYPADLDDPSERYNAPVFADGAGVTEAVLQSPLTSFIYRFYSGLETQPADPLEVSETDAEHTPAYRGVTRIVFEDYQLRENGRFDNFTFEIEPEIRDLAALVRDLWAAAGQSADTLDVSALAGEIVEGWIVNQPDLSEQLDGLQKWFNFDLVPIGGQLMAVRRGGESVATLDETELSAHYYGDEAPAGVVEITHPEEADLPGTALVNYLDPNSDKDFHTGTESFSLDAAGSRDSKNYTFPVVASPDQAHARAKRLLLEEAYAKPYEFAAGPRWAHLTPTDIVTLRRAGATDTLRLVSRQAEFGGLVKWRAAREKASLYTQIGAGQTGSGTEIPPIVRFPANSFLVLLDVGPLRGTDDVLGFYAAAGPRGYGQWRGATLYKQEANGEWVEVTVFDRPAMLGLVVTPLDDFTGVGWDRDSSLVVDFFHDTGEISSRPENDLLNQPLNVLAVNTGDGVEIVQYASATASAGTFPYTVRYTFSNFLRGRLNTEAVAGGHAAGQAVVALSDAVKFRQEETRELDSTRNYRAVTRGQNLGDAPTVSFHFQGWNQRPPAPVLDASLVDGDGNYYLAWHRRSRFASFISGSDVPPDGTDTYEIDLLNDGGQVVHTLTVVAGAVEDWIEAVETADYGSGPVPVGYYCRQRLDGRDTVLEAVFDDIDLGTYTPELQLQGLGANGATTLRVGISSTFGLYIYEGDGGTPVSTSGAYGDAQGRARIHLVAGQVRVYLNYSYPDQPPNYVSPLPALAGQTLRARASYGSSDGSTSLQRTTIRTARPDVVLKAAALEAWYAGDVPDTLTLRIYELSPAVGRGRALEVTI